MFTFLSLTLSVIPETVMACDRAPLPGSQAAAIAHIFSSPAGPCSGPPAAEYFTGGHKDQGEEEMRIQPEFPPYRVDNPMRRAEQTIYRILEESDTPGQALYEARIIPHGREVDFAVWLEDVGRFAVEIKGGRYVIDPGTKEWDLLTGRGRYDKPSPVDQVRDASKSIPEAIRERLDREVCITAVLALPDMEPDEAHHGGGSTRGR